MFYKLLGMAVWKGGKLYLGRRFGPRAGVKAAAAVGDPLRVVADRVAGREVDLLLRRAQVGVDPPEEAVPHRARERALPVGRRRPPVLVGVLVHVERVD